MTAIDLSKLTGSELIELYKAAEAQIAGASFPSLSVETVTDDGETYEGVRCPVCNELVSDSGSLYAVDVSHRWTAAEFDMEHDDVDLNSENGNYGDTLYYWHDTHPEGHAVSLPDGWEENWT